MSGTKAIHLDGGHRLWSGMERDGLRHATLPKTYHMYMKRYQWNILGLCEVRWKKTLVKHLLQKATSSFSVAVKTDMSMELDSSFTKTL